MKPVGVQEFEGLFSHCSHVDARLHDYGQKDHRSLILVAKMLKILTENLNWSSGRKHNIRLQTHLHFATFLLIKTSSQTNKLFFIAFFLLVGNLRPSLYSSLLWKSPVMLDDLHQQPLHCFSWPVCINYTEGLWAAE